MANHANVKTRKRMTGEAVNKVINRLNNTVFKNVFNIEYSNKEEHFWTITRKDHLDNYDYRCFWLNTPRDFEIRHGGGTQFMWWADICICNEIALVFNGRITDDGHDKSIKPRQRYYNNYDKYVKRNWSWRLKRVFKNHSGSLRIVKTLISRMTLSADYYYDVPEPFKIKTYSLNMKGEIV